MDSIDTKNWADPRQGPWYAGVPAEQVERLSRFRAEHPTVEFNYQGVDWEYLRVGSGPEVILLLPSALGVGESGWKQIETFSQRYQVIAPSYPPVNSMAELASGIMAILDHEGIEQVNIIGSSYGGLVAQVLARAYPERVKKLVVAHSGYPEPERGGQIQRVMRIFRFLPESILRSVFAKRMQVLLPGDHPEAAFTHAYFNEAIARHLNKKNFLASYSRMADLDSHYRFTPEDLENWPGEVLLIFGDNDPTTPPEVRAKMQEIYPHARVHIFQGTEHMAAALRQEEYEGLILDFLAEQPEPGTAA